MSIKGTEVLGGLVMATAILDRLLYHSTTVYIKGESYRLKEKRKAGLLGQARPTTTQPEEETATETAEPAPSNDDQGTSLTDEKRTTGLA